MYGKLNDTVGLFIPVSGRCPDKTTAVDHVLIYSVVPIAKLKADLSFLGDMLRGTPTPAALALLGIGDLLPR